MSRFAIIPIFLTLAAHPLSAAPVGQTFSVDRFSAGNGLSSNRVNDFAQDANGFIWLATSSGLERFDGNDFYNVSLRDFPGCRLMKDEVRSIDIKGDNILLLYDESADIFNQRTGSIINISDSLLVGNNFKSAVFAGDDTVLLGGVRGLFEYSISSASLRQIECGESGDVNIRNVKTIHVDNSSIIWVGTVRRGLFCKHPGSPSFSAVDGVFPLSTFVTSFASHNGRFYISTWDDGIYSLRADNNGIVTSHIDTEKLGWVLTYSMSFDERGNLWAGTPEGIKVISLTGDRPELVPFAQELGNGRSREVKSTFVDRSGCIWYTDQGNGVARASYSSDAVREINFLDLGIPYSEVTAIHVDMNNVLWAGINGAGLIRYDLNDYTLLKKDRVLSGIGVAANGIVGILDIPQTSQILLCSRYDGVYCVTHEGGVPKKLTKIDVGRKGLRYNFTIAAERASGNDAWIATTKGLVLLHSVNGSFEMSEPDELNQAIFNDQVEAILKDSDGTLWISTHSNGLFRISYDYLAGTVTACKRYLSGRSSRIQCLFQDSRQNIWAGDSRDGLYVFDVASDSFRLAENSESLPSGSVCSIAEDNKGILWISTDCGFACFDTMTDSKVVAGGALSGDAYNQTFIPRSVWCGNGCVMFGGYRGVCIYNPDKILRNDMVAVPLVTEIAVPGLARESIDALPPHAAKLNLKHYQRDVSFKFASVGESNFGRILYAFRMDKVDKNWRYCNSKDANVGYINLKPGRYCFRVKASVSPGIWTEESTVSVHVKPHPWVLLVVLLLIASGALVVAVYFYKKKKEEIEQDLISFRDDVARQSITLSGTDLDRQFVAKVVKIIEENLSNPDLDVEFLNSAMSMSNSTLYRKLKSITGVATKEFIRQTRYKYACKYLLEKSSNISDVAYRVGFANAKYFSLCFKKEFGITPSQYIQNNIKQSDNEKDLL